MESDMLNLSLRPLGYHENPREDMLRYIPKQIERTLEFGCGFGGFSSLLQAELGVETWGVEIDPDAAREAEKKLSKVINADALASVCQIPDGYFDCVIFFDILEHLTDPYSLLSAVKTKLRRGGVFVLSIPNIRYYRSLVDLVVHGNWDYKDHGVLDKTHLRFFTSKSIVKMFNVLDFDILRMKGIHPTSSRTFVLLNLILLNALSDVRYKHFVAVVRPKAQGP
jgi:2-polyprenyl-3-methyl-5-hydroxy-6-metoxy-1,4-benzoquinol methylase